jgi:hypothetical protein
MKSPVPKPLGHHTVKTAGVWALLPSTTAATPFSSAKPEPAASPILSHFPRQFEHAATLLRRCHLHATQDLIHALAHPHPVTPFPQLGAAKLIALKQLAEIFASSLLPASSLRVAKAHLLFPPSPPREAPIALRHRYPTFSHPLANATVHELKPQIPDLSLEDSFISAVSLDNSFLPSANAVIDPDTGIAHEYRALISNPKTKDIWTTSAANEFGRLAQGIHDIKGTDTFHFLPVTDVPKGRTATYALMPTLCVPNGTRKPKYTAPASLLAVISSITPAASVPRPPTSLPSNASGTPNGCYMCMDIKHFYLNTPMERPEYMRFHTQQIPDDIMEAYKLGPLVHHAYVYIKITKGMYGLPQAGKIANKLLAKCLARHGYFQARHTHGLWKHTWRPIQFTLLIDDFGVKYIGKEHANHLHTAIKESYKCSTDWAGELYCGIKLQWDYA